MSIKFSKIFCLSLAGLSLIFIGGTTTVVYLVGFLILDAIEDLRVK